MTKSSVRFFGVEKVGKWLPNLSTEELLFGVEKVGKWMPNVFSVVSTEDNFLV